MYTPLYSLAPEHSELSWSAVDLRSIQARSRLLETDASQLQIEEPFHFAPNAQSLREIVHSWEPEVCTVATLSTDGNRPVRLARLQMSFGQADQESWLVRVWEVNAPADVEPIEWILRSVVPVNHVTAALQLLSEVAQRSWLEDWL